ncbi:hypothetical protein H2200_012000 [Cladophialophora chaetospira]|uniref:Hemerythrin-like domain-containing protein n=1 Tax=Cladophialophora chaetospira TaxID=386627 RepID=A0AA39CD19_9EURO|nr:hypothetical protein H2200_012000 [Cladophialophora chaetospira]
MPFSKDSSHAANYVATQMALAHNGILRGLNSIYLQSTHLPHDDLATIRDFLIYCQCWSESMHHHHDAEEEIFFPNIEQISNTPGLMERNIEQHRAFTPGFDLFQEYARTCAPKDYDGQKMRKLIEDFAEPLTRHLHDEIETLRALNAYDSEPVRQAYKRLEKVLMATDNAISRRLAVQSVHYLEGSQRIGFYRREHNVMITPQTCAESSRTEQAVGRTAGRQSRVTTPLVQEGKSNYDEVTELTTDFAVWLITPEEEFLQNRFIYARWDIA